MQPTRISFKKKGAIFLLIFGGLLIAVLPTFFSNRTVSGASQEKSANIENSTLGSDTQILVTYFHTTARCPTCIKIERYSKETVGNNFDKELKEKKIVFRSINMDKPENRHFVQTYKLFTKSLIISLIKQGKEEQWKNLTDIWTLVRDQG